MDTQLYRPEYSDSWALIIGIDDYHNGSPLSYACSDAIAVRDLLIENFDFPETNVTLLTDDEATRSNIVKVFLSFRSRTKPDDRVLLFFAGHGCTHSGHRGEVGFLVPVDGDFDDLSTLIRWDELTRDAELIPAKHILFVMDACYGGLALTRTLPSGSMRFLQDILQRRSLQVLTAGKADQIVADSGGPIPDHSVFTGHFIQALEGEAANADGILTANIMMPYVYEKVATDQYSRQTPEYGIIEGDGDFVFQAPVLNEIVDKSDEQTGNAMLIEIPATQSEATETDRQDPIDSVKEYLSDPRYRIKLDDLVTQEIRRVLSLTASENFPVRKVDVTPEEVSNRLARYETATRTLVAITVLLTHWGSESYIPVIRKIITRMTERKVPTSGIVAWINLSRYPAIILMYSGGIGAIAGGNYNNLATLLLTSVRSENGFEGAIEAVLRLGNAVSELAGSKVFKLLPAHERHYVPTSEYLFKRLQPDLDDLLFLGSSYETLFDRFEVLLALIHADLYERQTGHIWGPIGRFGWKYRSRLGSRNPFVEITNEAKRQQDDWPPVKAGFFDSSYQRFSEIASGYQEGILEQLSWF
jgi:uncharacterized caspase-like protein